ncbi:MAG: archease [Chloroflexota bacterium]|nr:archease [Chloroflexota bacterium]
MMPNYAYFDHDADVGIIGRGDRLEDAFVAAAEGMFALMVNLDDIRPATTVRFAFDEPDPELALAVWLNRLLAEARAAGLIFGRFRLTRENGRWVGEASGEPWRADLERGVEVKGATLTALAVEQRNGLWEARCVLDV